MATKAQGQLLIDTNLESETRILAEQHREVENFFLNQLYGEWDRDRSGFPPIKFAPLHDNLSYEIYSKKVGNIVYLTGYVLKTAGGSIPAQQNIFEIIDSEFTPRSESRITGYSLSNVPGGQPIVNVIGVIGAVPRLITFTPLVPTVSVYANFFNGFYFVNP